MDIEIISSTFVHEAFTNNNSHEFDNQLENDQSPSTSYQPKLMARLDVDPLMLSFNKITRKKISQEHREYSKGNN
jgi:hypothetical protein